MSHDKNTNATSTSNTEPTFTFSEERYRKLWFESGIFNWNENEPRENNYSVDTPPPTVSGTLHMGHVFSYCHADFIARFQRMMGKNVFYPIGFDDNGLPTERLTEKVKGVRGVDMAKTQEGKAEFIKMCKDITEEAEVEFENLFKSVAFSMDWRQKYRTISDDVANEARASFKDLYDKGLIYCAPAPVFWDVVDQTALAQADIEDKEKEGVMNNITIQALSKNGDFDLTIMTTRPELLPACVAVLYHPDDARYNGKAVGAKHKIQLVDESEQEIEGVDLTVNANLVATLPYCESEVTFIADEEVKMDKGTGLVMCCLYGDWQDVVWSKRHNLYGQPIITQEGKIDKRFYKDSDSEEANSSTEEMVSVFGARECVVEKLKAKGLITKQAKTKQVVKCAERSGKPVEILCTPNWYIDLGFRDIVNTITSRCDTSFNASSSDLGFTLSPAHYGLKDFGGTRQMNEKLLELMIGGDESAVRKEVKKLISCIFAKGEKNDESMVTSKQYDDIDGKLENEILASLRQKVSFKNNMLKLSESLKFYPDHLRIRLDSWINGLGQDWCISRNRFSGISFPEIYYDSKKVEYVFDTWFTSAISPQINLILQEHEKEMGMTTAQKRERLFPMDLRPQAHEIIRTWTFYTLTKAYLHSDNFNGSLLKGTESDEELLPYLPWKNVLLSGWCLAEDKNKMSKSKGNIVTPVPLIESKGADVVRYWASTANPGVDTAYNEAHFKSASRLINKLRNVTKFVGIHAAKVSTNIANTANTAKVTEACEAWLLNNLNNVVSEYVNHFESYDFCRARACVERFFWNDLCDVYIEFVKDVLYKEGICDKVSIKVPNLNNSSTEDDATTGIATGSKQDYIGIVSRLDGYLIMIACLFAPFTPFVSEEVNELSMSVSGIKSQHSKQSSNSNSNANSEFKSFSKDSILAHSMHRRGALKDAIEGLSNYKINDDIKLSVWFVENIVLKIVEAARLFKSENKLSIAAPVKMLKITANENDFNKMSVFLNGDNHTMQNLCRMIKLENEAHIEVKVDPTLEEDCIKIDIEC